jgi:hypothetical protein
MRVGQMVHYVSYGTPNGEYASRCRAAVITEVTSRGGMDDITPPRASLCVLNPTGQFFKENLPQAETMREPGTWHTLEACDD